MGATLPKPRVPAVGAPVLKTAIGAAEREYHLSGPPTDGGGVAPSGGIASDIPAEGGAVAPPQGIASCPAAEGGAVAPSGALVDAIPPESVKPVPLGDGVVVSAAMAGGRVKPVSPPVGAAVSRPRE